MPHLPLAFAFLAGLRCIRLWLREFALCCRGLVSLLIRTRVRWLQPVDGRTDRRTALSSLAHTQCLAAIGDPNAQPLASDPVCCPVQCAVLMYWQTVPSVHFTSSALTCSFDSLPSPSSSLSFSLFVISQTTVALLPSLFDVGF